MVGGGGTICFRQTQLCVNINRYHVSLLVMHICAKFMENEQISSNILIYVYIHTVSWTIHDDP